MLNGGLALIIAILLAVFMGPPSDDARPMTNSGRLLQALIEREEG